jgi:DMSO/TMAO reductase YedYZ molybdopterin-dependent catalytic subunit
MDAVAYDPSGYYRRVPLMPQQMVRRVTPTEDAIVLCHLGVPRLARDGWSLSIDGLVERPARLGFDDLRRYAKVELASVHQCAGSPLQPFEPTRRICNLVWGGVRLADVLADCRPRAAARFLWSYGADSGTFNGIAVEPYVKDLPLERVPADALIAWELNGAPLPPEHGFPARLVVPGFYGTNSVKWLTRLELADRRAPGPLTTRWYNDPVLDAAGRETGETTPVWSIMPESVIVAPAPDALVPAGAAIEIWGWAWADGGVAAVEIGIDGETWLAAALEPPRGWQWQRFSLRWTAPRMGGITLASRAIALGGERQPLAGRRNAVYTVALTAG